MCLCSDSACCKLGQQNCTAEKGKHEHSFHCAHTQHPQRSMQAQPRPKTPRCTLVKQGSSASLMPAAHPPSGRWQLRQCTPTGPRGRAGLAPCSSTHHTCDSSTGICVHYATWMRHTGHATMRKCTQCPSISCMQLLRYMHTPAASRSEQLPAVAQPFFATTFAGEQGAAPHLAHCSRLRWPALAALLQHSSSQGQGGRCCRTHCSTASCPPAAAALHVLLFQAHGGLCWRAHCSSARSPECAAALHTRTSHAQPLLCSHCRPCRSPHAALAAARCHCLYMLVALCRNIS